MKESKESKETDFEYILHDDVLTLYPVSLKAKDFISDSFNLEPDGSLKVGSYLKKDIAAYDFTLKPKKTN